MADPIDRLAKLRIIKASADLEAQLRADIRGGGPAIEILRRLRDRAAESLAALAFVDLINETNKAIVLQNEVKRYDEWIGWLREIMFEGIAYDHEMEEDEREEMLDILSQTPEGEREAINLGLVDVGNQHE